MERRRKPRIYEPFPATVRGVDESSHSFEATTVLDNLSTGGLYLRLPQRVGKEAEVSVISRLSTVPEQGAVVAMRGRVVRSEPQADGSCGIAVMIKQRQFL